MSKVEVLLWSLWALLMGIALYYGLPYLFEKGDSQQWLWLLVRSA